jgi:hypothetical protein
MNPTPPGIAAVFREVKLSGAGAKNDAVRVARIERQGTNIAPIRTNGFPLSHRCRDQDDNAYQKY